MMSKVYLGDGAYAEYSEGDLGIRLSAPRSIVEHEHYIVLGPEEFEALLQFAMHIGWLKHGQVLRER